jgi:hypothetical protein
MSINSKLLFHVTREIKACLGYRQQTGSSIIIKDTAICKLHWPTGRIQYFSLWGELYDQGDAKWIVIRGQLRGHNDTAGLPATRGSAGLWAYLVVVNDVYRELGIQLFFFRPFVRPP